MTRRPLLLAIPVLALGLVAACSDDDGATTRQTGGVVIIGPPPPGDGGSVSATGSGCTTSGATTKLPDSSIEIQLDEGRLVVPATVKAGVHTVVVKNFDDRPHELVLTRAASVAALPVAGGRVDESALTERVQRIAAFPGNTICQGTFELAAGSYVAFSNVAATGGGTPDFAAGMAAAFTVS